MRAPVKERREAMVIDILSMNGTKELLLKMTPAERGLFLLFGYAANQVNVLWKIVAIATNETSENPVEERVSGAQTHIIVRLLIGVLWEAWRLVQERLLKSDIGREMVPKLDEQGREALDQLKTCFGRSNVISTVRNDFCFHYPKPNDMEAAFQSAIASGAMEEADFGIYFTQSSLNMFFFVSDYVFAQAIANAVQGADIDKAHENLLKSLAPIAINFSEVVHSFAKALFLKYPGPHLTPELTMTVVVKIDTPPNIDELRLPFYVDVSSHTTEL